MEEIWLLLTPDSVSRIIRNSLPLAVNTILVDSSELEKHPDKRKDLAHSNQSNTQFDVFFEWKDIQIQILFQSVTRNFLLAQNETSV